MQILDFENTFGLRKFAITCKSHHPSWQPSGPSAAWRKNPVGGAHGVALPSRLPRVRVGPWTVGSDVLGQSELLDRHVVNKPRKFYKVTRLPGRGAIGTGNDDYIVTTVVRVIYAAAYSMVRYKHMQCALTPLYRDSSQLTRIMNPLVMAGNAPHSPGAEQWGFHRCLFRGLQQLRVCNKKNFPVVRTEVGERLDSYSSPFF